MWVKDVVAPGPPRTRRPSFSIGRSFELHLGLLGTREYLQSSDGVLTVHMLYYFAIPSQHERTK